MVEPAPAPRTTSARCTASRASSRSTASRPTPTPRSAKVVELVDDEGVRAFPATHFVDGGVGAQDLAKGVLQALDEPSPYTFSFTYADELSLDREGRGHRDPAVRRRPGDLGRQGPAAAAAHRARRVRRAAGVRGQDAVLLLDRPDRAWAHRAVTSCTSARSGCPPAPGFVVAGLRRHDDDARAAQRPVRLPHRPRRRRDHPRPLLSSDRGLPSRFAPLSRLGVRDSRDER